jgi:hypothetical protein
MKAQQHRTRGSVAALAGRAEAFSGPARYSEPTKTVALRTAGKAGSCGFGWMPGINLDELAVK